MESPEPFPFKPVPLRGRRDGWSAERQRAFIAFLAQGFRTGQAARMVGMSRQTAYSLRDREGAESFAAAWDAAVGNRPPPTRGAAPADRMGARHRGSGSPGPLSRADRRS
jgi:hypothetical protein